MGRETERRGWGDKRRGAEGQRGEDGEIEGEGQRDREERPGR